MNIRAVVKGQLLALAGLLLVAVALTAPAASASTTSHTAVIPGITQGSCTNPNWVQLQIQNGPCDGFGFRGTTPTLNYYATWLGAGNNYGWVTYNFNLQQVNRQCFGYWPSVPSASTCQWIGSISGIDWNDPTTSKYGSALVQQISIYGWQ